MSREGLVDFSKRKEAHGRCKFHIIQATKNIDRHIFLMQNRIQKLK